MTNSTSLSMPRILLTLLVFASVHYAVDAVDIMIQNEVISYTLIIHSCTLILAILNMDVLELHTQRLKGKTSDTLLFTIVALILCAGINYIDTIWLHARMTSLNLTEVSSYSFFNLTFLLAYSFSWAISFVIAFKAITDHFKIRISEQWIILFSGVLFGAFTALVHSPAFTLEALGPRFIYFFLISIVSSYTYNQTNSILPMGFGYGLALLLINIF